MPGPTDRFQFTADRGDAKLRLDQVLVRRAHDVVRLSRHVAQQWIEAGAVTVAGRSVRRCSAGVAEGAEILVTLPESARLRTRPKAEHGDLDIVYEDEALIAVNKPAGLVVHPTYKTTTGTLLNALLWHVRDRPAARPSILTRLDKGTSGLVLVALGPEVHAAVQREAAAGRVTKSYLAIVAGSPHPPVGTITLPLARDPDDRRRVVTVPVTAPATALAGAPAGAPSETRYEVVSTTRELALVRCELVTGRTHQIRVHLASMGWPILGDPTYGVPHASLSRQALHAWRVSLRHPASGQPLALEAPMASDMAPLMP
jgi:23S rRNA pseudouridine1911/1915/1917 synthase